MAELGILAHFCNKLFKTPLGLYGIINIEVFSELFYHEGDFYDTKEAAGCSSVKPTMAFAAVYPAVPSLRRPGNGMPTAPYVAADGSALTGITARGIDVSHWKQSINWNAVAADDAVRYAGNQI